MFNLQYRLYIWCPNSSHSSTNQIQNENIMFTRLPHQTQQDHHILNHTIAPAAANENDLSQMMQ